MTISRLPALRPEIRVHGRQYSSDKGLAERAGGKIHFHIGQFNPTRITFGVSSHRCRAMKGFPVAEAKLFLIYAYAVHIGIPYV